MLPTVCSTAPSLCRRGAARAILDVHRSFDAGLQGALKKTERLGEATAPDGTVLTLLRHDGAYFIRVHGVELMSTRRHHSEDQFGELVCAPLREVPAARVLIGGLGLGFTLKAALRALGPDARIVVAEIVSGVIEWNRNPEYPLAAAALSDSRVALVHDDVANLLKANPGTFDAILLDVDNGADPLTTTGNRALYEHAGIATAVSALRAGGRLAYWSADRDSAFEGALRGAGLHVDAKRVRAHSTSGAWHWLLIARAER